MSRSVVRRFVVGSLALLAPWLPAAVAAQSGSVTGRVTGPDGTPVTSAQISLTGTGLGVLTGDDGSYTLSGVPAGRHALQVTHLAYKTAQVADVIVRSGEATQVNVSLESAALELAGVVVSASRRAERVTDAPATITRIDASDLDLSVGGAFSGALKQVKGLDFIQVGATSAAINARGFNSSFNNRMLMVEDGRISVLPESGLPIGQFTAIPKLDLAWIEILVGPGAALYGADASNGVLSLQTKDPFSYPGTTVEVSAGNRSYKDVQFRHADVMGSWGFKVAGEWQEVDDWENRLVYASGGVAFDEIGVDFASQVKRAEGSVVNYSGAYRFELSGGFSENDGVGQTNVGRNQFDGWTYNFAQVEMSSPRWYVNAYRNQSKSGDSYAINRYTVNRAAMPGATDKEVKLASDWPSDGQLYAAEVQNNFRLEPVRTELTWGAQIRRDVVSSDREWLTDRLTGEDVEIDQRGVYAQTRTELAPQLDLVLAARYDDHESYDAQFSPKAALVFKPTVDQSLRLSFNRAFKSPTILQTDFWIPDFVPFVGVFGNEGFTVKNAQGATVATYAPIEIEENTTWELGYKGLLAERLFLDVALFTARYENFFSPLTTIANPFAGTFAYRAGESTPVTGDTGNPQVLLTYFNLGKATLNGVDLGADLQVTPKVSLKSTVSLLDLKDVEAPETAVGAEATALNSPSAKWTLGAQFKDLGDFKGEATFRHVTGYPFRSGINVGRIPTFNTLDLGLAYEIAETGAQLTLGVSNLFTCRSEDLAETDPDERDSGCGIDKRHREMVMMPSIGTMVFLGVRYHHR